MHDDFDSLVGSFLESQKPQPKIDLGTEFRFGRDRIAPPPEKVTEIIKQVNDNLFLDGHPTPELPPIDAIQLLQLQLFHNTERKQGIAQWVAKITAWTCPLHKIKLDAPQVTLFAPMREARRVRTELRKTSPGHPLLRLLDTIGGHKARRNIRIGIPTRKGVKRAGTLQSKYSVVVHNLACDEFTVANGDESITIRRTKPQDDQSAAAVPVWSGHHDPHHRLDDHHVSRFAPKWTKR